MGDAEILENLGWLSLAGIEALVINCWPIMTGLPPQQYTAMQLNKTALYCCSSDVGQCPRCESVSSLTRCSPPTNATSPLPPTVRATTPTNPKSARKDSRHGEMTPTVTFLFSSTDLPTSSSSHKWCHRTLPSPTVTLGVSVPPDQ